MNRKWRHGFVGLVLCGALMAPHLSFGQGAGETCRRRISYGSYCGVHAVYGALSALGKSVGFESLLDPKYLSSRQGSTIMELKAAVEDSGGHAVALAGLGAASLRASEYPMIVHVASEGQLEQYNHWVLFLGIKDGKARIVDPPDPPGLMPLADLMARWDGAALVVADQPVQAGALIWADRATLLLWGLLAFGLVYTAHLLKRWCARERHVVRTCVKTAAPARFGRAKLLLSRVFAMPPGSAGASPSLFIHVLRLGRWLPAPVAQGVLLLVPAMVLAGLIHGVDAQGFLRNPGAREYVAASNALTFFPKLSLEQAREWAGRDDVLIVDARFRGDYERGHIAGAINVPIDAGAAERERILAGIPRDKPVLLYCQSEGCGFDDKMGVLLAGHGFTDISLFPGGWREWQESQKVRSEDAR